MTIPSVSAGSGNDYTITQIQKQITQVQKKLAELQADDSMDNEEKSRQAQLYQNQLTQLQTRLAQAQRSTADTPSQQPEPTATVPEAYEKPNAPFGPGQFLDEEV